MRAGSSLLCDDASEDLEDPGAPATEVTFMGANLRVPAGVFRPRAITAVAVDAVLAAIEGIDQPTVVDLGTGAGAAAIAVARARRDANVFAVDLSPRAVDVAKQNAAAARARITVVQGSIWDAFADGLEGGVDAAVANLPYVPSLMHGIREGPAGTVYGPGIDGLGLVRRAADDGRAFLSEGAAFVMQLAGRFQWEIIEPELRAFGYVGCQLAHARDEGAVVGRARWPGVAP
jgi:release factor glutamine methyltransferase